MPGWSSGHRLPLWRGRLADVVGWTAGSLQGGSTADGADHWDRLWTAVRARRADPGRVVGMEVVEALTWRGGVAEAAVLHHLTSRRQVRTALRNGVVVRPHAGPLRAARRRRGPSRGGAGCPASSRT